MDGTLEISAGRVSDCMALADLGLAERGIDAGGLNRAVRLIRLPDVLSVWSMTEPDLCDLRGLGALPPPPLAAPAGYFGRERRG